MSMSPSALAHAGFFEKRSTNAAADWLGAEAEAVHVAKARPAEAIVETASDLQCNLTVMSRMADAGFGGF